MVNRANNRSQRINPLSNNGMSCNGCNENRDLRYSHCDDTIKQLLSKLQAVDFSLVDTVLYLDVYPDCPKAISRYKELLCEKAKLADKLSKAGVPINNVSISSDSWNWIDSPWPWEYDANF